jgi:uncharacterized protein YqgQ
VKNNRAHISNFNLPFGILFLVMSSFPLYSNAQSTFNKTLTIDSLIESIVSIKQIPSGNYVFAGVERNEFTNTNIGLVFYKTTTNGDLISNSIFQIDSLNLTYDLVSNVIQYDSSDGLYVTGNLRSLDNLEIDGYLYKVDTSLQTQYYTRVLLDSLDGFNSILDLRPNNFKLFGNTNSMGYGSSDYLLSRIDSFGNILSDTTYGGIEFEQSGNGIKTNDNQYVVSGLTFSEANQRIGWLVNAANAQFIAVDSNFNQLWNTVLYSDGVDLTPTIKDFGFFHYFAEHPVIAATYREDFVGLIGQLDLNNGNLLWLDTINIEEEFYAPRYMETIDSTSFVVFFDVESPTLPYSYAKIIKYDNLGEMVWQRSYYEGNHNDCYLNSMIVDDDGFLVFGGTIANNVTQSQDAWILKLRPDGCLDDTDCGITTGIIDLTPGLKTFGVLVFPNPSSDIAHVTIENTADYKNEMLELQIYDFTGKLIYSAELLLQGQLPIFNIDVSSFNSGTYIIQTCVQGKECGSCTLVVE